MSSNSFLRGEEKAVCGVGWFDEILTTIRLLRYSSSPSALHPIFLCIPSLSTVFLTVSLAVLSTAFFSLLLLGVQSSDFFGKLCEFYLSVVDTLAHLVYKSAGVLSR